MMLVYVGSVLNHGSVVIAAITSCTNTSNPSVMLGPGLVAKKACELGLQVKSWIKTSIVPGSVVKYLNEQGFDIVRYGCTTCIENSGDLDESVASAISENHIVVAAVLSGNRNFEGCVHPLTRANYLASLPLVVAYALAGTVTNKNKYEQLTWLRGWPIMWSWVFKYAKHPIVESTPRGWLGGTALGLSGVLPPRFRD
ncbi:hypothetical protein CsSME_00019897 [Camellia sinensis var. sinensis]